MSIEYNTKLNAIKSILDEYNTTTASPYLSNGLSTPVQNIYADDPAIRGGRIDRFPAIFVSINRAEEEETQMGDFLNRKKQKNIFYDIHGIYKKEGVSTSHEDVITNFYRMAENVEAVLKKESSLSNTALYVSGVDTTFKEEQPENTFMKVFRVSFNVQYYYS